ncbi:hypothetical protein [Spongiivirga citrea]|uniref:Glyoxalase-like domain-containing protein n=1 Tax=Spongiivirga citrea TaxID=1481457 RepID=A0A6M0CKB2_9FLAO|nr:hypothetical protein [Spongiivirga citrea]NER18388.1 hypothetical protein [Spongiivirga citrea]
MNKYIFFIALIFGINSCKEVEKTKAKSQQIKEISTDLQVDHLNIWVENPELTKKKLNEIGFTSLPDSLSPIHHGQGTTGRYFNFLNSYLELIFVYNQNELEENNNKNKDLDFTVRAGNRINGASPFSIALKVKDYQVDKIPFQTVLYHQDWMEENMNIHSAKSSKTNIQEPSVFVVYPKIESDQFETLADLKNIPEEYAIYREFFKHKNEVKKLTNIVITSTDKELGTDTIKACNKIQNLTIESGPEHLMELFFDNQVQGKTFDLRPELPLVIYL